MFKIFQDFQQDLLVSLSSNMGKKSTASLVESEMSTISELKWKI